MTQKNLHKKTKAKDCAQQAGTILRVNCWQTYCQLSLIYCLPYTNVPLYNNVRRYSCVCVYNQWTRAWCWQGCVHTGQLVPRYTLCPLAQSPVQISKIWKRHRDEAMWFPQLPWQPLERGSWLARISRVMDWKALSSESLFDPRWSTVSWGV